MSNLHPITSKLAKWYDKNQRNLPWRNSKNPYHIWLSEVILQQTRVDQGTAYYLRFVELFPTVRDLAHASEDVVLHAWQGLGYYSRARNLHAAAKAILSNYAGAFPDEHEAIRKLKGVGDYTAAAIASIAFGLPHAAIDGNVNRVIARVFAMDDAIDSSQGKKRIANLATELLDIKNPGRHNQAMMELGALICSPRNPNCNACPIQEHCAAFELNKQAYLPIKQGKTKTRNRFLTYLIFIDTSHETIIRKRGEHDIWQGLYEFPLIETENLEEQNLLHHSLAKNHSFSITGRYTHVLSHQKLHMFFLTAHVDELPLGDWPDAIRVKIEQLHRNAFPRAITRYLQHVKHLSD